jgi:hypothetical protein
MEKMKKSSEWIFVTILLLSVVDIFIKVNMLSKLKIDFNFELLFLNFYIDVVVIWFCYIIYWVIIDGYDKEKEVMKEN